MVGCRRHGLRSNAAVSFDGRRLFRAQCEVIDPLGVVTASAAYRREGGLDLIESGFEDLASALDSGLSQDLVNVVVREGGAVVSDARARRDG